MKKKLIIIIFILLLSNLLYASVIDEINGTIAEAFNMFVVVPQKMIKSVAEPGFQKKILGTTYDEIIKTSTSIGLSITALLMLIAITMRATEIEKFQWEHVATCAIKAGVAYAFIKNAGEIYKFFNEIANEFSKNLTVDLSYSSQFEIPQSIDTWVALTLGLLYIVVILFTGIVFLLFMKQFVVRIVKMLIFQILAPIFISFAAWEKTGDLTKNFMIKYFVLVLEVAFVFIILNIAVGLPTILDEVVKDVIGTGASPTGFIGSRMYGFEELLKLTIYGLILYSLNKFSDKIMSYVSV